MATLFPILQFFDDDGVPLSGGKIYTYAASSSTPKVSYKQQSQSSNHTNPVILDSDGRPPANGIWLNGSYKLVIKSADDVTTYHTLDTLNEYNPYDWTGLTATISDINGYGAALGTPGTVVASKTVVVDASKNIATFGSLSGANLIGTTSVQTPLIKDANGVSAITIASTSSQVNSIKVTPAITGSSPTISAFGSDTNINLKLAGQGTGKVYLNDFAFPTTDGSSGQSLITNGAKVLSFSTVNGVKQMVYTMLHTLTDCSTILPLDNTIPQITEGTQILSRSITPTSASSTLVIDVTVAAASDSTSRNIGVALFQDATANALAGTMDASSCTLRHIMAAGTVASTTFTVRVGPSAAGHVYVNGTAAGGALFNGVCNTSIMIWEIFT